MKSNKHLKPETLEFRPEDSKKEEKHLEGFTLKEKQMIKLMASIFVEHVMKDDNSATNKNSC